MTTTVQTIAQALGNGEDLHAWPPGLTEAEAVHRLRVENARLRSDIRMERASIKIIEEENRRAYKRGAHNERARLVGWLRKRSNMPTIDWKIDDDSHEPSNVLRLAADLIEQGKDYTGRETSNP
jgi:hypothetical protein